MNWENIYDGWQVVEERESRGGGQGQGPGQGGPPEDDGPPEHAGPEEIRTYTYGNYIDEPLTMTTSRGNKTYYYHTNNLYNVRALTDERGRVVERYRYSAYGEVTILNRNDNPRPHSTVDNVYMFQGRRFDPETGLYYYRHRYYSVVYGRFISRDPWGYIDGLNLYKYVGGSPLLFTDAYGLS